MFRSLTIRFEDREKFVQEYQRNLANGGIFVPTEEHFDSREVVEVEMDLAFCERSVTLQGEVVSRLASDLEPTSGHAGIAVQFLVPADELRDLLGGIAGVTPPPPPPDYWPGRDGPARQSDRLRACVNVKLECGGQVQNGRTRNLSRSGVLLATDGAPIPVGQEVRMTLVHPTTSDELRIKGKITRHAENDGRIVAMAVQFDLSHKGASVTQRKLDLLRAAAHAHLLGGIRGPIEALGLPNLLQMFASTAEAGTMTIKNGHEEGRVAFENGTLRHAAIGSTQGPKAMARMMAWEEGEFWFLPAVDPDEPESEPQPIYGAVLEAVTQLDELRRLDTTSLPKTARVCRELDADAPDDPDKLVSLLLDLATAGTTVGGMLDSAEEVDTLVYQTLLDLVERGMVRVEES
jgi:Tfp pilus assembly protein PilZ